MSLYKKILRKIAHFQTHHPYFTILTLIILTVLISGGLSNVKTVASLEKMMPEDMEEIKYFNVLRDNFLGKDMIGIVIDVDVESQNEKGIFDMRDKRVLEYIKKEKSKGREIVLSTAANQKIADKIIVALLIGNIYNTSSIPAKPLHCMLNYGGFFFAREVL